MKFWKIGDNVKFIVGEKDDPLYYLNGIITDIDYDFHEGEEEYTVMVTSDSEYGSLYLMHADYMLDADADEPLKPLPVDPVETFVKWIEKTYNDDIPIREIYELYKKNGLE